MDEEKRLLGTLKRVLKGRGMTYGEIARRLGVSEATVKRQLAAGKISVERLAAICEAAGTDLFELARQAAQDALAPVELTLEQERALADDERLLATAYHLLNGRLPSEVAALMQLKDAELVALLTRLDRFRLIELLPGNAVRMRVTGNLRWRRNGPLWRKYTARAIEEFFADRFDRPDEVLRFLSRELSPEAQTILRGKLEHLAVEFVALADADSVRPAAQRANVGMMLAIRPWTFSALAAHPPER